VNEHAERGMLYMVWSGEVFEDKLTTVAYKTFEERKENQNQGSNQKSVDGRRRKIPEKQKLPGKAR